MSKPNSAMAERISVLGLGNWGTALANHLALNGHGVLGWSIEPEVVKGINESRRNPFYQSQVELSAGVRATSCLEDLLDRSIFLLVIPSSVLGEVVPRIRIRPGTLIVSAIKGLEAGTLLTPLSYTKSCLREPCGLSVLSGPSFAKDIAAQKPCGIVAASEDADVAKRTAELFSSDSMRVYMSLDPLGVEIGAVVKNVIALAAGICDGMDLGDSARAGLITRGLAEMMRLADALGADRRTLSGLSGLGDLVMTATCDNSRNRTVGLRLGKGEKLENIVSTLGSVAESVKTTPLVLELARRNQVDVPITEQVARLLLGETTPHEVVHELFSRPLKMEC